MKIRVAVAKVLPDGGLLLWEQIKVFDSHQIAIRYCARMDQIYGEAFSHWVW